MPTTSQLKHKMRDYSRKHKLDYMKMRMDSDTWGVGARVNAWRITGHAGKASTSRAKVLRLLYPDLAKPLHILPKSYRWAHPLTERGHAPGGVVWHNAAASSCTADAIHSWHLSNGWSGIAYHFFVDKEGRVWRGRPEDKLGGHTLNFSTWLGVCTEGSFDKEYMGKAQLDACIALRKYLDHKYHPRHKRHRDMMGNATSCPGKHFDLAKIVG